MTHTHVQLIDWMTIPWAWNLCGWRLRLANRVCPSEVLSNLRLRNSPDPLNSQRAESNKGRTRNDGKHPILDRPLH